MGGTSMISGKQLSSGCLIAEAGCVEVHDVTITDGAGINLISRNGHFSGTPTIVYLHLIFSGGVHGLLCYRIIQYLRYRASDMVLHTSTTFSPLMLIGVLGEHHRTLHLYPEPVH